MTASPKWRVNQADLQRVGRNALIFIAPLAIVILTMASQGVTEPKDYISVVSLWILNVLLDFFRKLEAGKKLK